MKIDRQNSLRAYSETSIPCSDPPQTSNKIIQKGLAFVREQSGTATVPGASSASGSCPAGCIAEAGLWWWRRTTPHQRNGGSRCQSLPIRSSSFCLRLCGAVIAELTCRQTLRAKWFERPSISSSAPGCWKRSAPMARCWAGDAMLKLGPWRFASPSRASKRSGSRTMRLALLRRHPLVRLLRCREVDPAELESRRPRNAPLRPELRASRAIFTRPGPEPDCGATNGIPIRSTRTPDRCRCAGT